MKIKEWFLNSESFTQNERFLASCGEISIQKETEKAVLLKITSDYGFITKWCPKSAIDDTKTLSLEEILNKPFTPQKSFNGSLENDNSIEVGDIVKTKDGLTVTIKSIKKPLATCDNGKTYVISFLTK